MSRVQHILPSGIIFAIGLWVSYVSFTQQPAGAFLFPRLISVAFVLLAGFTFGKAVLGLSRVGTGLSREVVVNLAPGLLVAGVYIFWAAATLGFYTATTAAFFILLSLYDPAPHGSLRVWAKRAIITACFMAVMYGLFAVLLKAYTPREILF
jgi:hypothetical protein